MCFMYCTFIHITVCNHSEQIYVTQRYSKSCYGGLMVFSDLYRTETHTNVLFGWGLYCYEDQGTLLTLCSQCGGRTERCPPPVWTRLDSGDLYNWLTHTIRQLLTWPTITRLYTHTFVLASCLTAKQEPRESEKQHLNHLIIWTFFSHSTGEPALPCLLLLITSIHVVFSSVYIIHHVWIIFRCQD